MASESARQNCSQFSHRGIDLVVWKATIDIGESLQHVLEHHEIQQGDSYLRKRVLKLQPVNHDPDLDEETLLSSKLPEGPTAFTERPNRMANLSRAVMVLGLLQNPNVLG